MIILVNYRYNNDAATRTIDTTVGFTDLVIRVGGGFLALREAYISNLSLLGSLEPFKHSVVSGMVVGWEVVDGVQSHFSDHP